jgi:hypothetical protein
MSVVNGKIVLTKGVRITKIGDKEVGEFANGKLVNGQVLKYDGKKIIYIGGIEQL